MKKLTYYLMKGSENDGYYLLPNVDEKKAITKLGIYENLGEPSEFEFLKKYRKLGEIFEIKEWKRQATEDLPKYKEQVEKAVTALSDLCKQNNELISENDKLKTELAVYKLTLKSVGEIHLQLKTDNEEKDKKLKEWDLALELYAKCHGCSCEYECSFKDSDCWLSKDSIAHKQERKQDFLKYAKIALKDTKNENC